ncbi:MAG: siderophore-interacting protein [Acidimicrobiales bacterium]
MSAESGTRPPPRTRREPPPLRPARVVSTEPLSPRLYRVELEGPELGELVPPEPAGSVRLFVPGPAKPFVLPTWNGNEFLDADGTRPILRTFTPLSVDVFPDRLALWVVRHPGGAVSRWAQTAAPGSPVAVSGPGRGYEIDRSADHFVVLGDETALPAIAQLLPRLPSSAHVQAHIEVVDEAATLPLPTGPLTTLEWHRLDPGDDPGSTLVAVAQASRSRRARALGRRPGLRCRRSAPTSSPRSG